MLMGKNSCGPKGPTSPGFASSTNGHEVRCLGLAMRKAPGVEPALRGVEPALLARVLRELEPNEQRRCDDDDDDDDDDDTVQCY